MATQIYLFIFTSKFGEDDFQFDEHFFRMGWFNHQPILISADKTMFFAIFGFSKVKLLNPRREMAVITHILGLKTFMFHGFGVQGNLVPNMAAIEKKHILKKQEYIFKLLDLPFWVPKKIVLLLKGINSPSLGFLSGGNPDWKVLVGTCFHTEQIHGETPAKRGERAYRCWQEPGEMKVHSEESEEKKLERSIHQRFFVVGS